MHIIAALNQLFIQTNIYLNPQFIYIKKYNRKQE